MRAVTRIVIVGGGPGGYEAALVAAQHNAEVVLVERAGLGGATVLTDCVPSKTLIATADVMTIAAESTELGVIMGDGTPPDGVVGADLARVNARVKALAQAQSADIGAGVERAGVRVLRGTAALDGPTPRRGRARGRRHRGRSTPTSCWSPPARTRACCAEAAPDGERILTWQQVYDLPELPQHLVVVGSGVTGAEFASAYTALGLRGHARVLARPRAARRGRRRRPGARGRLPPARDDRARPVAGVRRRASTGTAWRSRSPTAG